MYAEAPEVLRVTPETLGVVKLDLFFHDLSITSATAFVYRYANNLSLVTNWHVLTGVHPTLHTKLDASRQLVPNRLKFYLNVLADDLGRFDVRPFEIELLKDGQPVWFEPNVDHAVFDVAMIPLQEVIADFTTIKDRLWCIRGGLLMYRPSGGPDGGPVGFHVYPRVGSDVFVLGFPRGIGQGTLPIWKKGSIASEPLFGAVEEGTPVILIDAATRDGMSGSPVLYFGSDLQGDLGNYRGNPAAPRAQPYIVGVYAGREVATPDENKMTIGRVWKVEVLDALVAGFSRRRDRYFGSPQ